MSDVQFDREAKFLMGINFFGVMLKDGVITEQQYRERMDKLVDKDAPLLGLLPYHHHNESVMEPILITNKQLAEILNVDVRTAKAWCLSKGITPENIGTGKRKYLRWNYLEVKSAAYIRKTHSNEPSFSDAKSKQTVLTKGLLGKSIKELMVTHSAKAAQ